MYRRGLVDPKPRHDIYLSRIDNHHAAIHWHGGTYREFLVSALRLRLICRLHARCAIQIIMWHCGMHLNWFRWISLVARINFLHDLHAHLHCRHISFTAVSAVLPQSHSSQAWRLKRATRLFITGTHVPRKTHFVNQWNEINSSQVSTRSDRVYHASLHSQHTLLAMI